jgi:hypothetical protein
MIDRIIFALGSIVFVLFFAGLIFTIREVHNIGMNPEKNRPKIWFPKA